MTQLDMVHQPGHLPNTCQYSVRSGRGDYVIQVAWPLVWSEERLPPDGEENKPVSILYLVDANAYFATAVDITRRIEFTGNTRSIVIGIGYPRTKYVYDWRRGPDLTPPTPDGEYEMPLDSNGQPRTDLTFGEADDFLAFIQIDVMTYVENTLFAAMDLTHCPRGLYGHSYGGLFTLNALYTRPSLFDFYMAASPTLWWNNYSLARYQEAEFLKRRHHVASPPSLVITWGSPGVDQLERRPAESEAEFRERQSNAEEKEMRTSARELIERLMGCPDIANLSFREFVDEDHGSAAVVGLQRGIMEFLRAA